MIKRSELNLPEDLNFLPIKAYIGKRQQVIKNNTGNVQATKFKKLLTKV